MQLCYFTAYKKYLEFRNMNENIISIHIGNIFYDFYFVKKHDKDMVYAIYYI